MLRFLNRESYSARQVYPLRSGTHRGEFGDSRIVVEIDLAVDHPRNPIENRFAVAIMTELIRDKISLTRGATYHATGCWRSMWMFAVVQASMNLCMQSSRLRDPSRASNEPQKLVHACLFIRHASGIRTTKLFPDSPGSAFISKSAAVSILIFVFSYNLFIYITYYIYYIFILHIYITYYTYLFLLSSMYKLISRFSSSKFISKTHGRFRSIK